MVFGRGSHVAIVASACAVSCILSVSFTHVLCLTLECKKYVHLIQIDTGNQVCYDLSYRKIVGFVVILGFPKSIFFGLVWFKNWFSFKKSSALN